MNKENTCCLDCYWENPDRTEKGIEDCSNVKCYCHKRSQCNDCFDGDHKCVVSECECWCKTMKYNYIEDPLGRVQKVPPTWEEEFDKNFQFDGVTYRGQRHWKDNVKQKLVKSFIRSLIQKEREAAYKEGHKDGYERRLGTGYPRRLHTLNGVRTDTITEILGIVEGMKKVEYGESAKWQLEEVGKMEYAHRNEGFNKALSDLKEKLSELIKKQWNRIKQ